MTHHSDRSQVWGLAAWLAVTYAAAAIGGLASTGSQAFYQRLDQPDWSPPAWLFAPVWSVLYTAMALGAWLVWRERGFRRAGAALTLYLVQLAVNAVWTWLFFAWRRGGLAFVDILLLAVLIAVTIVLFGRVRVVAAALLVPYLAWVVYATMLTYAVWQRNPLLLTRVG